jgi:hypothetical protein
MKPIEFDCKQQGCGLKVCYERQTLPGAARKRKADSNLNNLSDISVPSLVVYLTCADGHVHRYQIPRPEKTE